MPVIFLLGDEEVAHILADSEAKVVITSTDMVWKVEGQIGRAAHPPPRAAGRRRRGRPDALAGGGDRGRVADLRPRWTARRTTSRSSSTPPAPPGCPRAWRCPTPTSSPTRARRPRSTSWTATTGRVAVLPLSHSYGLTVMNAGHILGTRGGAAALVQSRGGAEDHPGVPGGLDVRGAHHVRLPPELSRRVAVRHLVHARRGAPARRRCRSRSSSPSRRSSAGSCSRATG